MKEEALAKVKEKQAFKQKNVDAAGTCVHDVILFINYVWGSVGITSLILQVTAQI